MQLEQQVTLKDIVNYIKQKCNKNDNILIQTECAYPMSQPCIVFEKTPCEKVVEVMGLPSNLFQIFSQDGYRMYTKGMYTNIQSYKANISIFSCALEIFFPDFDTLDVTQKMKHLDNFIKKFYFDFAHLYTTFNYKSLGWKKRELISKLNLNVIDKFVIRYLADFLHINIFTLDIKNDKLIYNGSEKFMCFKKSIFLFDFSNNNFQPIQIDGSYISNYNSSVIKKLVQSNYFVEYANTNATQCKNGKNDYLPFLTGTCENPLLMEHDIIKYNDADKSIDICKNNDSDANNFNEDCDESENVINIAEAENKSKLSMQVISKMKIAELKLIAQKYNIDTTYTNSGNKICTKTRMMLINNIKSSLKC